MKNYLVLCLFTLGLIFTSCEKEKIIGNENNTANIYLPVSKRSCGLSDHMKKLLSDPAYRKQHNERMKAISLLEGLSYFEINQNTVLPVAVHFQNVVNPDIECLRQLAQSQVDVLNKDYSGTNSDITKWINGASSTFPGVTNGKGKFKFCIATKNHPSGYGLSDGDPAVTVNKTSGDFDAKWSGYINIFVQPNIGVLGYSPLGGIGNGDGVVIDAAAFGKGLSCGSIQPQAPYNLGRTLTHEMGHYLMLEHIWGGGCGQDDQVSDTPDAEEPHYNCPQLGIESCGSSDLFMNYMDYVDDDCMYMFSEGQVVRSTNYIGMSLQNLVDNAANVCVVETSDGTCSDGIKNGKETGIDCGGPDCKPCDTTSACQTPSDITVREITAESAKIEWLPVSGAVGYMVRYKEETEQSFVEIQVDVPSLVLIDLLAGKTYEYQVKSICSDEEGEYSPISTFGTKQIENGCTYNTIGLNFVLDDYGSDVKWVLINEFGEILYQGGNYEDGYAGIEVRETFCLEDGCYTLIVNDAYEDGLCCEYGEGSIELVGEDGEFIIGSDGVYGSFEVLAFCVEIHLGKQKITNTRRKTSVRKNEVIARSRKAKLNK